MEKDIFFQLNKLKAIKPDREWKLKEKELLMSRIAGSSAGEESRNNFFIYIREAFTHELSFLSQPVATAAIVLFLIMGGGLFSISAASEATPGSFLYTAKLVGEKTQFAFTAGSEEKIMLQILFAERRGEEIRNIAVLNEDKVIGKVADSLREEIGGAKERLSQIETENPQAALELAKTIENRTSTLRKKLVDSKQSLSKGTSAAEIKINEAIRSVDAAGLSALSTIVRAGEKGVDSEDLNKRVAAKLENTKEKISEVQDDANKIFSAGLGRSENGIQLYQGSAAAEKIIVEAEAFLKNNDYEAALDKINESESIINEAVEKIIDESKNAAEEEKGTSTPEVKGASETADGPGQNNKEKEKDSAAAAENYLGE